MADVIGGPSLGKAGSSPVERPNHPVPHVSTGSRGPPAQEVAAQGGRQGEALMSIKHLLLARYYARHEPMDS